MSREMVAEGHIETKEGAEELKREQRNAKATTAWRQQWRGVDETSTTQRSCTHAVQCCGMTMLINIQGASVVEGNLSYLSNSWVESFSCLLLNN